MPYIPDPIRRAQLNCGYVPANKAELNYVVFRWARKFIAGRHYITGKTGYTTLSDAAAALHEAANEVERRFLWPYEDECIEKNGDVLP